MELFDYFEEITKEYYIGAALVSIVVTAVVNTIGHYALKKIEDTRKDTKLKKLAKVFATFTIFFMMALALYPTASAQMDDKMNNNSKTAFSEEEFDLYNDEEIKLRIDEVNRQLKDDGKAVSPKKLKAFTYLINGDYSLINVNVFDQLCESFINIDIDQFNILLGRECNDTFTPTDTFASLLSDPYENKVAVYWSEKYEKIVENIYKYGDSDENIRDMAELNSEMFEFFYLNTPIVIDTGDKVRADSISDEATFFISWCILRQADILLLNLDEDIRPKEIVYSDISDEPQKIETYNLYENLSEIKLGIQERIRSKIEKEMESDSDSESKQ